MLFLNDQPVEPILYALTDVPRGRWSWEEVNQRNVRLFAEAGLRLFQVDLFLEQVWPSPDGWDLELARRQVRGVLDVCPDAAVMIRFHVNAPRWWQAAHPEEETRYANREPIPDKTWGLNRLIEDDPLAVRRVSVASHAWREAVTPQLARFCQEFAETEEGRAVFSLQVAGGIYGEWHYWGLMEDEPDMGPAMTAHFRRWLRDRYGDDAGLQAAWSKPDARLDAVEVPGMAERQHCAAGLFRDPSLEQAMIDYWRCQHEVVADAIIHFCGTCKRHWPRELVTGAFYGYYFAVFGRDVQGGHLEPRRVLESAEVDFLSAPNAYYPGSTDAGGAYRSRGLLASCRLHGKLWLQEMDQCPSFKNWNQTPWPPDPVQGVAILRRNGLQCHTEGMGFWYYDFGPAWSHGGGWDHPELMEEIRALRELCENRGREPFRSEADVLCIYDTEVYYHLPANKDDNVVTHCLVNDMPLAMRRAGCVMDTVYRFDLPRVDLAQYRLVVFANTFLLTAEERDLIRNRVVAEGRHVVFFVAPGFSDGRRLNAAWCSEVTGLSLCEADQDVVAHVTPDADGWPAVPFGIAPKRHNPLFAVDDAGAERLGTFPSGETAFARKSVNGATSWFSSQPIMDWSVWGRLFDEAGVHRFTRSGDPVWAGGGVFVMHVKEAGLRTLHFKDGTTCETEFPAASTVIRAGDRWRGPGRTAM